jgi:PIN domain nuclease of toxin-antitoxin system
LGVFGLSNYLLDTHVWLWLESNISEIGKNCLTILKNTDSAFTISPISSLELAQLKYKGKINFSTPLNDWIYQSIDNLKLITAPFNHEISIAAYEIELNHKDPADRILAATALTLNLTLVTADRRLLEFSRIKTLDAKS